MAARRLEYPVDEERDVRAQYVIPSSWPSPAGQLLAANYSTCSSSYVLVVSSRVPSAILSRLTFEDLVREWKRDTRFVSSLAKIVMHPAYQAIIGMGKDALPLVLDDLRRTQAHWLWALHAITQEDPAPDGADFETAVAAWLAWGRERGYI